MLVACVTMLVALCLSPSGAAAAGCSKNEAIRAEQGSTYLPECRAYELVSPPGAAPQINSGAHSVYLEAERAAASGERLAFYAPYPPGGASTESGYYLATRSAANGWLTASITPQRTASSTTACLPSVYVSRELTSAIVSDGYFQTHEPPCGYNEPRLVTGEPPGWRNEAQLPYENIFLREDLQASPFYQLVNRTPESVTPSDAHLQGASTDFTHVVFSEAAPLTGSEAPAEEAVYEWRGGAVHLVSVLPNGTPVSGYVADGTTGPNGVSRSAATVMHAISSDGERVVFEAEEGHLYLRINATGPGSALEGSQCVQQTADACTVPIAGAGARFLAATDEGTDVFFMAGAEAKLTASTVEGSGENLYEYEVTSGTVKDLTGGKSEVGVDGIAGFGEAEGSGDFHLYFVADGELAPGAVPGECATWERNKASELGSCSMYGVSSAEPAPAFVGKLQTPTDSGGSGGADWALGAISTRVSPDGRYVAFNSAARMPTTGFPHGYDNMPAAPGDCGEARIGGELTELPCDEIYLYDSATGTRVCATCVAERAPSSPSRLTEPTISWKGSTFKGPYYLQRSVTDEGQLFFQTEEPLVERDENKNMDVYELVEGAPHLISSGAKGETSLFAEAAEGGSDVFFATDQALVGSDQDEALSLYDARVDGGFPEPAGAGAPCEGEEECKGAGTPLAVLSAPTSVSFSGAGNLEAKPQAPTRSQRLAGALRRCRTTKHGRRRRARCVRRARMRYGTRAQKLRVALRSCARHKQPSRRQKCRRRARRRYRPKKAAQHSGHKTANTGRRPHRRGHHGGGAR